MNAEQIVEKINSRIAALADEKNFLIKELLHDDSARDMKLAWLAQINAKLVELQQIVAI